jgi:hypothetical protein
MPNNKWVIAGFLVLIPFPASVAGGDAPERPDQKRPAGAKSGTPAGDSKAGGDAKAGAAAAALLESAYQGQRPPESVRMLAAVLRGSQMGPGDGWFGPAQTRYSWKWLAERCGVDPAKGKILPSGFRGPPAWFARLDRNKDGVIAADDLDWSERNPFVQMSSMAARLFRKLNAQGNGILTKDEWLQFFEKAAQGKNHLSFDDFRDALLENSAPSSKPSDMPPPAVLIRGLFAGELGSMNEGPKLNDPAPDFTLKTVDGKDTVQLSKLIGAKPVALIFGSFT